MLKNSKAAYDAALDRSEELEDVFDRLANNYQHRYGDVKRAGKSMTRAEYNDQLDDRDRLAAHLDHLEKRVMAPLYLQLKRVHEEHELVMRTVHDNLTEIAQHLRNIRAIVLKEKLEQVPQVSIKLEEEPYDGFSIYFGGIGRPDGIGHGHYVFKSDCTLKYYREAVPSNSPWQSPVARWRRM